MVKQVLLCAFIVCMSSVLKAEICSPRAKQGSLYNISHTFDRASNLRFLWKIRSRPSYPYLTECECHLSLVPRCYECKTRGYQATIRATKNGKYQSELTIMNVKREMYKASILWETDQQSMGQCDLEVYEICSPPAKQGSPYNISHTFDMLSNQIFLWKIRLLSSDHYSTACECPLSLVPRCYECRKRGYQVSIKVTKNGKYQSELTIMNVKREMHKTSILWETDQQPMGQCELEVYDVSRIINYNVATQTQQVIVEDGSKTDSSNLNQLEFDAGTNVTFTCEVTGKPRPEVKIRSQRSQSVPIPSQVTQLGDYVYKAVATKNMSCTDTSFYVCEAFNGIGESNEKSILILVRCPPQLSDADNMDKIFTPVKGNDLNIEINILGHPVPNLYTLTKLTTSANRSLDGQKMDPERCNLYTPQDELSGKVMLPLYDLTDRDNGHYQLDIQNGVGDGLLYKFKVNIEQDPFLATTIMFIDNQTTIQDGQSVDVVNGEAIQIHCRVQGDLSQVKKINIKSVDILYEKEGTNITITVTPNTPYENQQCLCTAVSSSGMYKSTSFTFNVQYESRIIKYNVTQKVIVEGGSKTDSSNSNQREFNAGTNVTFMCEGKGKPRPEVKIRSQRSQSVLIPSQVKQSGDYVYRTVATKNMSCTDTSFYVCEAVNGIGKSNEKSILILVRCSPELPDTDNMPEIFTLVKGCDQNIEINILGHPVPTRYTLTKEAVDGKEIDPERYNVSYKPQDELSGKVILRLYNLTDRDNGHYQLDIQNGVGDGLMYKFKVNIKQVISIEDAYYYANLFVGAAFVIIVLIVIFTIRKWSDVKKRVSAIANHLLPRTPKQTYHCVRQYTNQQPRPSKSLENPENIKL